MRRDDRRSGTSTVVAVAVFLSVTVAVVALAADIVAAMVAVVVNVVMVMAVVVAVVVVPVVAEVAVLGDPRESCRIVARPKSEGIIARAKERTKAPVAREPPETLTLAWRRG
jgi:hypothetical protein